MKKTLIVTNQDHFALLSMIQWLLIYKEAENVEFVLFPHGKDALNKARNLNSYDNVWLFVDQEFGFHWPKLQAALKYFDGNFYMGGTPDKLKRFAMREVWRKAGLYNPGIVRGPVHDLSALPFGPPYIARRDEGHQDFSNPEVIWKQSELEDWLIREDNRMMGNLHINPRNLAPVGDRYVIEEFVDTSVEGIYHQARVTRIGDTIYPKQYQYAPKLWNPQMASPEEGKVQLKGTIGPLANHFKMEDFLPYFDAFNSTICALDFSMDHQGRIVPWEIVTCFAIRFANRIELDPEDITDNQTILNAIAQTLEFGFEITYEDVFAVTTSLKKIMPHLIKLVDIPEAPDWRKWCSYIN